MAKILNKDPFTYQQEKDDFLKALQQFHACRGTPFDRIPRIGGKEVDLYLLYRRVISFGGWRKISTESIWEQILRDFKVPKGCSNGTQALKYIYVRHLDTYEKIHFHGADPKEPDIVEEHEGPLRKKTCLPVFGIPQSYNYDQHKIHGLARPTLGMSTDFRKLSDYDKLEKALLSGLPNEVDFVINVCTLLSNESRHTLLLDKSPQLLKLLLAHIGIFDNHGGSYEEVYERNWRKLSNRDYINFWYETVADDAAKKMIHTSRAYKQRDMLGKEVLHLGPEKGIHDKEGQRIMQMSVIMRNLSFEEENMKFMSQSELVFRFLMLCVHCSYGSLRQLALDTLGNIAEKYILTPNDNTYLVLQLLRRFLASDDKYDVVRGLEILSKLCLVDENEAVLTENLADQVYSDIVRLMNVFDIQIIVYSLEALYQMSELGEHTTTKIAAVKHAVDLLVTLLTVEAQSYGPNSLVGIKVVEYCPPSHIGPGGVLDPSQTGVHALPISQPLPPSHRTAQQQFGGNAACDVEATTCSWIQSAFEQRDGTSVSHVHLYAEYINFAKKFSLPQILPSQAFLSCVKLVFPSIEQYSTEKPDGLTETGFRGVCKRKNPLPFTLTSSAVNRHRASSVVHSSPAVMSSPNQSSSATVDLTQTPTLRQRLMEPPKLSALQASPSLLPLGGAEVTKQQQSAIYTSSKPPSLTQTSSALQVQVSQGGNTVKQGTNLTGYCTPSGAPSPNVQSSTGQHNLIQRSQNIIKQKVHSIPPPLQSPSLPQQTGPPQKGGQNVPTIVLQHQNFQPSDQMSGIVTNQRSSNDTRMIKTLLANKLRHQSTPVPIAPKVSPSVDTSNPMHLLTFTTQQSTVIQGQLQQQNLSPQAFCGVSSSQQYEQYPAGQVQIQGIQSIVDNSSQQYMVSNVSSGISTNSSQQSQTSSSHRSRSPKSEKSKGKSKNSPSRSGSMSSRSASPKGTSPKRKSSNSSRSSSPRAVSPRNYELEVCGEVERAKDVVQVGLEARIERVENNCLKQIQSMKQNISVNIPSTSHQMISPVSLPHVSQNIILPIVVGSTNTGQTGNLIAAAPSDPCHVSTIVGHNDLAASTGSVLHAQVNNIHVTSDTTSLPEQGQLNIVLPANTQVNTINNSIIPNTMCGNDISVPCSNSQYADSDKLQVNSTQLLSEDQESKIEETIPVVKEKPKLKYVCSQDETEAAVSSLLINEDETQQSISNGSDTDVALSSAVVNETGETEAAISAITGLLDDETDDPADDDVILNHTEDLEEDIGIEQNGIEMPDSAELGNKQDIINNSAAGPINHVDMIESSDNMSVPDENGKDKEDDLGSRTQGIMLNGVVVSPDDLDIIPSPTSDKCDIKVNGLGDSDLDDFDSKKSEQRDTIDKMAAEKLAKMNGIINHIGNGDYKEGMEIEMTLGEGVEEGVILNADGVSVVIQAGEGDQLIMNSQDTLELNGDIEAMDMEDDNCNTEKSNREENIESNGTEPKCYELAGEPETTAMEEDEDEVIIENEMFLQPATSCASVTMETNVLCEQKENKLEETEDHSIPDSEIKTDCEETRNELPVADAETGCVDILKAAIESEKIDEIVLNGDSNDSMPVVTQDGIYQSDIQYSVSSESIPIGNEMTTTVPSSGINFIPNVFSTVQTGLVVGAIVSLNNNMLTTTNVPLTTCINDNINSKARVSLEVCPNRHVPTPETSRDSELSCDSIASSLTDSSIDKHSISIQQPFISVQPNIQTTNILSVQTVPAKSQQIITTVVTAAPNQTSPRSRSGEKRPKKRNRNASGSADSRCSSSSSSNSKPSYTAVQQSLPQFMCEWAGCKQCFENVRSVFFHVHQTHLRFDKEGYCQWEGCEKLQRKKWSLVTHVQDHHCSEIALKTALMRRQSVGGSQSQTVPALVYPPDAAWQAIRRFSPKAPYPEFTEPREGPVTKHIRLTAALVLRNLARYSSLGRSLIKKHERHISFTAMSALESSNALANCLFEILHDH